MNSIKKYLVSFILMMFCTLFVFSQTSTNSAVLYGTFTQSNSQSATVPIPVEIVRQDNKILELRLNISNVTQLATNQVTVTVNSNFFYFFLRHHSSATL